MKLYFGNLPDDTTDAKLQELVAPFGKAASATVVTERDSGRSRGFGFVEFDNDAEAKAAIDGLNGREVGGKTLVVNEARPRKGGTGRG
ncbi:MAG TPA: RNA-binding protein [Thermoanaerobaculia bacterium]